MPLKELRNGLRMPWAMSFTFSGALWNLSIGLAANALAFMLRRRQRISYGSASALAFILTRT